MPKDKVHVKSAKYLSILCGIGLLIAGVDITHVIAFILLFMFNVMYLSPDLDMWCTQPTKRWGPLKIWFSIFEKRIAHRSKWSHGWLLGLVVIHLHFWALVLVTLLLLQATIKLVIIPVLTKLHSSMNEMLNTAISIQCLIDPLTNLCNFGIADVPDLVNNPLFVALVTIVVMAAIAAQWHHNTLDLLMKNKA